MEEARAAIGADDCFPSHIGWLRSYIERMPVDRDGHPIPWYTYASIDFLMRGRVKLDMTVFEYGCGNSTLWWAGKCKSVTAVDNSPVYVQRISDKAPVNVKLILQEEENGYVCAINGKYDIICVDGIEKWRDRTLCVSPDFLKPDGVIILDNSCDERYKYGVSDLHSLGFKQIDFWGFTPICTVGNCTSIFYRKENCFNI